MKDTDRADSRFKNTGTRDGENGGSDRLEREAAWWMQTLTNDPFTALMSMAAGPASDEKESEKMVLEIDR